MTFDAPNTRSAIIVQKRLKNDQVNLPIEKCYRVRHLILINIRIFKTQFVTMCTDVNGQNDYANFVE
jgi:hypothetical protein